MKKIYIFCIVILLCLPVFVKAETLNQYIARAEKTLKQQKEATSKKQMTESEKNKALEQKTQVTNDITTTQNDIEKMKVDIENLKKSITKKDKEIKEIMKFVQVSSGDSVYLEYAFGASSFTDFIYRVSVAEQLSNYNDSLIKGYNKDIKNMEQKQKDLSAKEIELNKKQKELGELIKKLSNEIEELDDSVQSYAAEYKNLMAEVNSLESLGCKGHEQISVCRNRQNQAPVIGANGIYMPLEKGKITQNYYGKKHNAIDMTNYEGANVYAAAGGVVKTISHDSCGKNIVYIIHNVNGQKYTTVYYHLKTYNVSKNQVVTHMSVIGTQGGNPSYDSCSTGSHLDFKLFRGEYLDDFFSLTNGPHVNPRIWLTQAPSEGKRFYGR